MKMRNRSCKRSCCGLRGIVFGLVLMLAQAPAPAQLAITEAMSSSSLGSHTDFWELTNFGDETIELSGYKWGAKGFTLANADSNPFTGLSITGHESIVFVERRQGGAIPDEAAFQAWWGEKMPANTRIFFYAGAGLGLNSVSDEILLWGPNALNDEDYVDHVTFGKARQGSSFTYDTNGLFGMYSVTNEGGAFLSALYGDVGSPGIASAQVPADILTQPVNVDTCAGLDATFSVLAAGFPRPRYQWYFNGMPLAGATASALVVSNAQMMQVGDYFVEVRGGTNVVVSQTVTLTVDTNRQPPKLVGLFPDVQVISNETARFAVTVCANPPPTFQWRTNGVVVAGATNRSLVILNAPLDLTGLTVCVEVENALGTTSACAQLTVIPRPLLMITEVMPAHSTNCLVSHDWFELTDVGTNEVDLYKFRFKTLNGAYPTFTRAQEITNHLVLQPGESAVFVEGLDSSPFRDWWGVDALPLNLKLYAYTGDGLGAWGDELYIWTPGEEDPNNPLTFVGWQPATPDVSLYYTNNGPSGRPLNSEVGVRGAIGAASCMDIGSPGYTTNPPPRFSRIVGDSSATILRWRAISNATYRVRFKNDLREANWQLGTSLKATNWVETWIDSSPASQRFYRLEQLPLVP